MIVCTSAIAYQVDFYYYYYYSLVRLVNARFFYVNRFHFYKYNNTTNRIVMVIY